MPTTSLRQPTADSAAPLWRRFVRNKRSIAARNALVDFYAHTVKPIAHRLHSRLTPTVLEDDLLSAGLSGLLTAIRKFDPSRGVSFATFSYPRILGAMYDEIRRMDWVPRLVRIHARRLEEAEAALHDELRRAPTERELARRLKVTVRDLEVVRCRNRVVDMHSLDHGRWFGADSRTEERGNGYSCLPDKSLHRPSSNAAADEFWAFITRGLNQQERLCVLLYYRDRRTMKAIGASLGLSESRVSQSLAAVRARLKKYRKREDCFDMLHQIG